MRGGVCTALALLLVAACGGRALPPEPSSAALYRDVERIVSLSGASGWHIDRKEVEELLPAALMSACQVEPEKRERLLRWVDQRIAELGGPVEEAYRRRGNDLDEVKDLLELTRIRMVLAEAIESAPRDCPFWVEPDGRFEGRQILDDRWLLHLGGGGQGILSSRGGQEDIRAGGAGRLLFGRVFGSRWALMGGAEVGASAAFPKEEDGERSSLVLGADVVFPAVLRYILVNTYFELEGGFLVRGNEKDLDPEPGYHVGVSFGGNASRRRWILPGAALGLTYQRTFPDGREDPLHMMKVGFRVALDLGF